MTPRSRSTTADGVRFGAIKTIQAETSKSGYPCSASITVDARHGEAEAVEKHAGSSASPGLKVNWITMGGGGAQTDAMLAGSVDVANTGVTNLLLLWDRTKRRREGVVATSAQPLALMTRDP